MFSMGVGGFCSVERGEGRGTMTDLEGFYAVRGRGVVESVYTKFCFP